jgi:hypothetical protein
MIDIQEEASAIHALASLVGVLTAGPDADTAIEGIRLIMLDIRNRAENIESVTAAAKASVTKCS